MEDDGMTDLQFKSFLKQLVGRLEEVRDADGKEAMDTKLVNIIIDLRSDIES